jgi:hypothetical protein
MVRREMLGMMAAGAAGLAAMGGASTRAAQQGANDDAIEVMGKTAKACAEASHHCLQELKKGGSDAEKHARALAMAASCEKFCTLSAMETACASPLAHLAHEANAEACRMCAEACQAFDDQVMKHCAECCRQCAETCRAMARKHAG